MGENKDYIKLEDLEVYQLSRALSKKAWAIYSKLNWQMRKIMGDQFIESSDSIGANLAEAYGRYHYLDRIRFLYNSRGSKLESVNHWLSLMHERGVISDDEFNDAKDTAEKLAVKLNNYIKSIYNSKNELK
ncbi:four helix bundle protein [Cecembia calidifontis]|jgi:four helix bundle protein|uniref:Four helix bundle protein n=1 Tax=Cecembia calidifontis TaxID=1187080 RepID=A0A4Q7PHF0_9BACT|nr:four helix bundle protein [Cecembia calidifontis]RZS98332.1 four helix bundle protein [Cecembia calidifontis]